MADVTILLLDESTTPDSDDIMEVEVDGVSKKVSILNIVDVGAGAVLEADYNANTILAANTDNTPAAVTIAEQQVAGRLTSGNIKGLSTTELTTLVNDATESLGGKIELATLAECTTGTDTTRAVTPAGLRQEITNAGDWVQTTGTFTAAPASTSTITMTSDLTTTIIIGTPLKYVIGGVTYYGICTAITSILLTVAGAPLSGNVTSLYYGKRSLVSQIVVMIPGLYEDASNSTLIASDLNSSLPWDKAKSYCVKYRVYSKVHDTGTHGKASVYINSAEVNSSAGGLTIAADATWYSTMVDINVSNYDINTGEIIEITSTKAGNGDATDLTVSMTFVTP